MQVTVGSTITVENPSQELIQWCSQNLKIRNPDYSKKVRMHFWVGNTPEILSLYEVRGNALILPFGTLRAIAPMLQGAETFADFSEVAPIDFKCRVPLYDYQQKAVDEVLAKHYGILQSPAGSGKTQMGISLVERLGRRTLWLTHTKDLLNQSKTRAEQYMKESLIGTITEGKVSIGKGITFATIQTMCRLDLAQYKYLWDVIIVDECFPENTMVQTPHGNVPIQFIVPGELVVTRNDVTGKLELCQVEELQVRELKGKLVRVTLNNGQAIVCTSNHPFYTQDGYKSAGDLTNADEVRMLWKGFRYFDLGQESTIKTEVGKIETALLKRVRENSDSPAYSLDGRNAREISTVYEDAEFCNGFRKNEEKQPYVRPCCEGEDVKYFENNRAQAYRSRWKWARSNRTAESIKKSSKYILSRNGVRNTHKNERVWLSNSLQNRHSSTKRENSNRSRWWITLLSKSSDSRYEKSGVLTRVRVESVEVLQRGSNGTFDGMCGNNKVYNLSVKHNHNYFANGVLVHNCHRVAGTPTAMTQFFKVLNSLSARHKYGLSATVHRSDGMIKATYALLGTIVYTVPDEAVGDRIMKVGIRPVLTGVKLDNKCLNTDGTLNYTRLISYLCEDFQRNHLISSRIVVESEHPSLILSDRLEHLETLMSTLPRKMQEQAVMISGKMTSKKGKAEREQAIEDMRTGKKKYLFATYSLAREGLDIPCLERLYMATPQKDYAIVTQSIGRIARTADGKQNPVCFDFVDDIGYLFKSYKKRCSTYKKNGCYLVEEGGQR